MSYFEAGTLRPSPFSATALSLLFGYQKVNRGDRLIQSSPNKNLGFTALTGQSSSSQWTIDQVQLNQVESLSALATFGTALLFSADASFKFEGDTLIVSYPHMPDFVNLNLIEGNSTIELVRKPSLAEALKIFGKGSVHMGLAIIRYFEKKYPGVPDGAEILAERRGEVDIRITDKPEIPNNDWGGGGGKPAETHVETRVKFKDHYSYKKEDVDRNKGMWD